MLGPIALSAVPDAGRPSKDGDPPSPSSMRIYVVCFLYREPRFSADEKTAAEIQRAHLAHLSRLIADGKLLLVGPFRDKTDLRGMCVFDLTSVEEAQELCAADPAVRAGSLRFELHPWYAAKGIATPAT